ncbi:MAG: radical SAM protein [Thermoplasmatota archaeon]
MSPFWKRESLKVGVHHFHGKGDLAGKRFHLRIDSEEKGILIMDASRMLILNGTGIYYAYYILSGLSDAEIVSRIRNRYRVKRRQVEEDLKEFRGQFDKLLTTGEIVSGIETDLSDLYKDQTAPYRMDLAITYKCDNDCGHCYNEKRDSKELSTEEWKRAIDILWERGIPHIIFTGGEPTQRSDLPELIAHAEGNGQITGMNTNGRKLKSRKYLKKLVNAGLDHIQITIGSLEMDTHDSIVGREGAYGDTVKGIRNVLSEGVYLVTNTTIMRENQDEILDTVDFLRDMGVSHIAVNSLIRSGKGKDARGISIEELQDILKEGRDKGRLEGFEFRWYTPTPYCLMNPMELDLGLKQCTACKLNMAVEPDGSVLPCQSYYEPLGNILKDDFDKIWNHKVCRRIRTGKFTPKKCRKCDLRIVCGGGCPLSWKTDDYICLDVLSS